MFKLLITTDGLGEADHQVRTSVAAVLQQAAQQIASGSAPSPLRDANGAEIGSYEFLSTGEVLS